MDETPLSKAVYMLEHHISLHTDRGRAFHEPSVHYMIATGEEVLYTFNRDWKAYVTFNHALCS